MSAGFPLVRRTRQTAFSLVEVVIALGVIAFAIVAIFGVIPTGLRTSAGAQDETRAAQLAQAVLSTMASQAQTQFNSVKLRLDDNSTNTIDLAAAPAALDIYADNEGKLISASGGAVYAVSVKMDNAPAGFDSGYANLVTVSVGWPAAAPTASRTTRSFMRIVSKY